MNPLDGVDVAAEYLSKSYQAGSGLIASAVALYSSYMMIEVARRVRAAERELALGWLITGAMCVGTGVWASHFMGLLSMRLPVEVGYDMPLTVVSWFLAVISVGVVLSLLARAHLAMSWRILGALTLATGICATHYLGILSLGMHTGIDWDFQVMALSGGIALAAMIMASSLIRHTLDGASPITLGRILLAALPCSLGLRAVQYAALNAAHFPMDAQSLSMGQLSGQALAGLITVATGLLFAVTQMAIVLDKRLHQRQDQLAHTLQHAHHELEDSAHRDALTRLFNRRGFERHLSGLLSQEQPPVHDLVMMFINLDGFKLVNQSLGHGHGDALLKQAATRLSELIRREDVVAHVAADEFVMLFQGRIDQDTARSLAQRAAQALATPFTLGTHEITLSCSIGIALAQARDSANELISRAELAMRNAKAAGGGAQCFYEEGMLTATAGQIDLQRDLRLAIERGELMLYYQPKRHAQSGQCSGVEALLRWKHGTRGMVSPGEFIPLAERFGLIGALGSWVIHEACRQVRTWQDVGIDLQVAVNLSVHQLRQPDLAERIRDTLAEHGVAPQRLIFEITESVAMENVKASLKVFEQLAAIGVQLSIDDFGTGYSSLSYLSKLPASQLKIDRSFVMELDTSSNAQAIVEAVVRLAHALKLKVVAEGVETESQHQTLLALGCDELQGFLFARPMPAADLAVWLPPQTHPASRPDEAVQAMDSDSDFALLL